MRTTFWKWVAGLGMGVALAGCHVGNLSVYKIDVQQGNILTQDEVKQLHVGMTPDQVRFLLGSPLVVDTFHPERWDYAYSYRPGTYAHQLKVPPVPHRDLTLWFKDGKLARMNGLDQVPEKAMPTPFISNQKAADDHDNPGATTPPPMDHGDGDAS